MVGAHETASLTELAKSCLNQLRELQDQANNVLSNDRVSSRTKRRLLTQVLQDVGDDIHRFDFWRQEFAKGEQTSDQELLKQASQIFDDLQTSIATAKYALNARLQYRRAKLFPLCFNKRQHLESELTDALKDISKAMDSLNSASKVVRGRSRKQEDREQRKDEAIRSLAYNAFKEEFSTIQSCADPAANPIVFEVLWKHFPGRNDLDNKVGNLATPGDGLLYREEHVARAQDVLQDLETAWRSTPTLSDVEPPKLQNMSKLCLILKGMQKPDLLLKFLDHQKSDSDLRLEEGEIREIFGPENESYVSLFYTEQSRAVPRAWGTEEHREFQEGEPMPLLYLHDEPMRGSYGFVMTVEDVMTGERLIRKQQIITQNEKDMAEARNHIRQETARLKGLDHRHCVQFVKSYERGSVFGLIMRPVANSDLRKLMDRYKKNGINPKKDCLDSEWLRPVFYTAFGCLAQGLSYIHSRSLRHKDVKPENILFEQSHRDRAPHGHGTEFEDRFLWADFGLAYDFSDKESSKTKSTKLYSARYAPPEVFVANARRESKTVGKLEEIPGEDGEVDIVAEMSPDATIEDIEEHGRAADRFALGCIFFELLARLLNTDLPLRVIHPNKIRFAININNLHNWAEEQRKSETLGNLRPMLDVADAMIKRRPDDRMDIDVVVQKIMEAGEAFSCKLCCKEHLTRRPPKSSRSPPASEPDGYSWKRLSKIPTGISLSSPSPPSNRGMSFSSPSPRTNRNSRVWN